MSIWRIEPALGLAQRQMEHCAAVFVIGGRSSGLRRVLCAVQLSRRIDHLIRKPHSQTATLSQRLVIHPRIAGYAATTASSTRLARSRPKPSAAGPDAPRPLWRCPPLPAARDDVPMIGQLDAAYSSRSAGIAANMGEKERRHLLALTAQTSIAVSFAWDRCRTVSWRVSGTQHRLQIAGTVQPGAQASRRLVLNPLSRPLRDQRGRHYHTILSRILDLAVKFVPCRSGFVAEMQMIVLLGQPAHQPARSRRRVLELTHVAHFARPPRQSRQHSLPSRYPDQ